MKTIEKLKKAEELVKELKQKLQQEKNKPQTIKYQGKTFRVYKWDKKVEDFKYKKNEVLAEYFDVIELINNEKLEFTKPWNEIYVCKNQFKRNKEYLLAGVCLNNLLGLFSNGDRLSYSDAYGRVVVEVKK